MRGLGVDGLKKFDRAADCIIDRLPSIRPAGCKYSPFRKVLPPRRVNQLWMLFSPLHDSFFDLFVIYIIV